MAEIRLQKLVGDHYADFWKCKKRYRVMMGGRASKKSKNTAQWYIINMMKYPDANLVVIRKVFKDHRDSTYAELKWAINRLGVEDKWYARVNPFEITYLPTGQKILFRGLDDPMSITSIAVEKGFLCWFWLEEAFQISSEQDFNMIDGSLRGLIPEPLFKQITLTLNPWNERHWIKKRFFDNPDDNTFTQKTNYLMNEFLGADDLRNYEIMKENNPRRYWVEGLGNWGVTEGLVFQNWTEQDFNYVDILRERKGKAVPCFGLDFGYTADPTGFVALLLDMEEKKIWVFDEIYEKGMLNNEIAKAIIEKGYAKERIIADSAEPKSIAELKRLGIDRIKPARKGNDSIINGIQFLLQFQIIIHPSCVNTNLELNNYAWDKNKDGKIVNTPIKDYNHIIDPMRYCTEEYSKGSLIRFFNSKRMRY